MKRLLPILIFATNLWAQAELVTDRPDQTESSSVMPKKRIQIETGVVWEKDKTELHGFTYKSEALALPATLLRYGLTRNIEFRLGSQYLQTRDEEPKNTIEKSGMSGLDVGTKISLFDEDGSKPETAVILNLALPVGSDEMTADEVESKILFAMSNTYSPSVGIGYNLGVAYGEGEKFTLIYSAAMGIRLSSKLGGFFEFYGSTLEGEAAQVLFDAGLTYLLKRNLQIDFSSGYAMSEEAPDMFISGGFSWRLPK